MAETSGFLRRHAKRILVIVAGSAVLIAGVVLLILPGPGTLVILAGLAILASEFDWAERLMKRIKERAESAAKRSGTSLRAVVIVGILFAVAISVGAWFLFR